MLNASVTLSLYCMVIVVVLDRELSFSAFFVPVIWLILLDLHLHLLCVYCLFHCMPDMLIHDILIHKTHITFMYRYVFVDLLWNDHIGSWRLCYMSLDMSVSITENDWLDIVVNLVAVIGKALNMQELWLWSL